MKQIIFSFITCAFLLVSFSLPASSATTSLLNPDNVALVDVMGVKYPNSPAEGTDPVVSFAKAVDATNAELGGFDELVPFILPSPNQEDAGSCLYMANTGMAEWWLARLNPEISKAPDGPIDLSERYLMSLAGIDEDGSPVKNWRTDTIYLFNNNDHRGVLNTSYRFTKGWYMGDGYTSLEKAEPGAEGAQYGAYYNWINELDKVQGGDVDLPFFERDILFLDSNKNQWAVGKAPEDIVDQVKARLIAKKAPVQVIYNHFGYWHAVYIIGFNDEMGLGGCPFVERARKFYPEKVVYYKKKLETTTDPAERQKIIARINKYQTTSDDLEQSFKDTGGCHGKGVVYVRDSIYSDSSAPLYDYDKSQVGEESHYSKTVVLHEYEWLTNLSNHATQVFIRP